MSADRDHLRALIETAIYVSPEPVPLKRLARATGQPPELLQEFLNSLIAEYDRADRGVRLRFLAGGYTIGTKPNSGPNSNRSPTACGLPNRCQTGGRDGGCRSHASARHRL